MFSYKFFFSISILSIPIMLTGINGGYFPAMCRVCYIIIFLGNVSFWYHAFFLFRALFTLKLHVNLKTMYIFNGGEMLLFELTYRDALIFPICSTSQSLGKLSRVTIWHDRAPSSSYPYHNPSQRVGSTQPTTTKKSHSSSDPIKACYINRVTVVDIHTLDLYDFPVFEWIGPGFRDGRTDRIIFRRKAKSLEKVNCQ